MGRQRCQMKRVRVLEEMKCLLELNEVFYYVQRVTSVD